MSYFFYLCDIMAVREQTLRLHKSIKEDFDKLSSIKEYGVVKYTVDYRLNKLAEKYFKSPKTIENIVFGRTMVFDEPTNQLTIDL